MGRNLSCCNHSISPVTEILRSDNRKAGIACYLLIGWWWLRIDHVVKPFSQHLGNPSPSWARAFDIQLTLLYIPAPDSVCVLPLLKWQRKASLKDHCAYAGTWSRKRPGNALLKIEFGVLCSAAMYIICMVWNQMKTNERKPLLYGGCITFI